MKKTGLIILSCIMLLLSCQKTTQIPIDLAEHSDIQLIEKETLTLDNNSHIHDIISDDTHLYLSDSANQLIYIYDKNNFSLTDTLSSNTFELDHFTPTGLALHNQHLYILDSSNRLIITYHLTEKSTEKILIPDLENALLNDLMSIALFNDKIYLSVSSNHKKENNIYELSSNGQLKTITKSFIGYLNAESNYLLATNAYALTETKQSSDITTDEARLIFLDQDLSPTHYTLDAKVAPYKLYSLGDFWITSSLGATSIIKYDLANQTSKIIYTMEHSTIDDAFIGMLTTDKQHNIYLVNNSNHTVVKLVYSDETYLFEY